jgi:predicted nuclease of predicted toxin-antitoxin system
MRFYLDEMFSHIIAGALRARNCDAVAAVELGYEHTPDEVHLAVAARDGRAVVTQNYDDFASLTDQCIDESLPHSGVIMVPTSIRNDDFGTLIAALLHFDREHPDGLEPYTVVWLTRAPE